MERGCPSSVSHPLSSLLHSSYCLLRLPKTSELKNKKIDFVEEDIDLSTIPYTDKAREESRLIREEKEKKERELKAQQAKENAQAKSKKRTAKEEAPAKRVRKGKHERIMDEWEELQEEEMLYHKLRKGKISQKEYDEHLLKAPKHSDDEEEDSDVMEEKMNRQHQLKKNIRKMKAKKSKRFNKH